jgi:hypothetical protein
MAYGAMAALGKPFSPASFARELATLVNASSDD